MKKRLLSLLLVMLMLASLLSGCASDKETKDASGTDANPAEDTDAKDNASTLKGDIVYWSMWQETEPQAEILKNAIARFEAANPDCSVSVEWNGRAVRDLVLPALEAGTQIDVFDADPTGFYAAAPEKLLDVTDFYESAAAQGSGTIKDNILPGLVNWDSELGKKAGLSGNHSVPYSPYVVSWFYNKQHFADAGITKVPETWEEFDDACAKLVAAGHTPITIDDAYLVLIVAYYIQRAIGIEEASKLAKENGALWDNPQVLKMIEAMEDFAKKGYFSKNLITNIYPAGQAEFALGNASMTMNGSWFPAEVAEIAPADFQWGEFAYPTVPDGASLITENTIGGQAFMVNGATGNKEAVYELLRYFVSDETQQEFFENGLVPCTKNTEWPAEVSDQKAMVEALTANVGWAGDLETDFVLSVGLTEILKVISGDQSAQDCYTHIKKAALSGN